MLFDDSGLQGTIFGVNSKTSTKSSKTIQEGWQDSDFITLRDLFVAYRKAKKEAYYDPNCAHGLKFALYERNLQENLESLLLQLGDASWGNDSDFIGTHTYIPKSIKPNSPSDGDAVHFCVSDPLEDWTRYNSGQKRAVAEYRLVIDATVDFMVVSALWVIKVGHKYDACLDSRYAVGSRLRRHRALPEACAGSVGDINENAHSLFLPYFSAYGGWRQRGLKAMKSQLEEGHEIVAVTMDLERFYHNIDPTFLLDPKYLKAIDIKLTKDERTFTKKLLQAIVTWRNKTPDKASGVGLPVGLTASSVIANVLLKEFDTAIIEELMPAYYGRYVDDVFLVVRPGKKFRSGQEFLKWLVKRLRPIVTYHGTVKAPKLKLNLPYADGSELIFAGNKQKMFQLAGKSGLDLIHPIIEKIREQSSEYRLLPALPDDESDMATRALLVTPNATLEADALRKADSIMLRRMGFSLLLSDVEAHARDLEPESWLQRRKEFYGLAERHLLSPRGIFDFYKYIPRIVGLMIACRDWSEAVCFLSRLKLVRELVALTTEPGDGQAHSCWINIRKRIYEAILQSRPYGGKDPTAGIKKVLKALQETSPGKFTAPSSAKCESLSTRLMLADWGRTSYAQLWANGHLFEGIDTPDEPDNADLEDLLQLDVVTRFQRRAKLTEVHWPAVAFPTRPLAIAEMTRLLPVNLRSLRWLRRYVSAFRGAWMPATHGLALRHSPDSIHSHLFIPDASRGPIRIAVTNLLTTIEQWKKAMFGAPDLSLERYDTLNRLLNNLMQEKTLPTYVALPECALPRRWMMPMARKLAGNNISLLAGLEYERNPAGQLMNEALVSLTTDFSGYPAHICLLQPKLAPAWGEAAEVQRRTECEVARPRPSYLPPIYVHRGIHFGLLLCSDLTDIRNRSYFQGWVDALFVLEWNQDVNSFSALVESGALDLHAFIIQANNRLYGDSRIRVPYREPHKRDLVRVKGGVHDYFVIDVINYQSLREFQSDASPDLSEKSLFKPFPIGFEISPLRKIGKKT